MEKSKLKKKDIRFFIIPFLILFVFFAVFTYKNTNSHIKKSYEMIEQLTLNVAESYSQRLITSHTVNDIISTLLDEKLLTASQAVLLTENNIDNNVLTELAKIFMVDEIYFYNDIGEIIYSNIDKYIGWKAYEEHPVYNFMISGKDSLVEDLRADTESGIYYKYAYFRSKNNTFIQVGVSADNVQTFLQDFQVQQLMEDIMKKNNVHSVFFIDTNYKILASTMEEYTGLDVKEEYRHCIETSKIEAGKVSFNENEMLHVCAPIYYNNENLGTLSMVWPSQLIDDEVRNILLRNTISFVLITITIGIILYYAYRKNKSNIEIAYYDKLTGLPNNEYLHEYLNEQLNTSNKKKGVLLLNCTNFKLLKLTYGFNYGDVVIKKVANSIESILEPEVMLFRQSTDRFLIFINDYYKSNELVKLSGDLINAFNKSFEEIHKHSYISAQVAILEIENQSISVNEILQEVSLALDNLKGTNKSIIFYKKEMGKTILRKDLIEQALKATISGEDTKSFSLVFQPKLNIKTNKIIGFEALSRLDISGLSIPPPEFIELAEERNLIFDLGNIVLRRACEFIIKLRELGNTDAIVAVNISSIQLLRYEFVDSVRQISNDLNIDLNCIEFEITESVFSDKFIFLNKKLEEIKKLGILVSLDDFGTGYSSFARLQELNIDSIKIDKSFIARILQSSKDNLITADIISMAHKMGLTVVAEGVEKEVQKEYLRTCNCDIIQGYHLSKPLNQKCALEFIKKFTS